MKEDIIYFPPVRAGAPFEILLAGKSWCDGSYRINRNNEPVYVLEYIVKGRGYLNNGEDVFYPQSGDVYIIHAGIPHEYGSSSDAPWEKIWFNVQGHLMSDFINRYGLTGIWHIPDCGLEDIFLNGVEELRQQVPLIHECASLIILRIIQALSRHLSETKSSLSKLSPEGNKLKNMLDYSIMKNPSISDMAKYIARSESQTIRIFKRDWGMTPYQYLLNKRIELAKLLLINSAKSIKAIAYELSFTDEFYFSDIFKKKTGMPPSTFRKQT